MSQCWTDPEYKRTFDNATKARGPCPNCRGVHACDREDKKGTGQESWSSVQLRNCPQFLLLTFLLREPKE